MSRSSLVGPFIQPSQPAASSSSSSSSPASYTHRPMSRGSATHRHFDAMHTAATSSSSSFSPSSSSFAPSTQDPNSTTSHHSSFNLSHTLPPLHSSTSTIDPNVTASTAYALRLPNQYHDESTNLFASQTARTPTASSHNRFFYKLVAKVGPSRFVSIYDGTTEYVIGQTLRSSIRPAPRGTSPDWRPRRMIDQNRGGIFVCRTPEAALEARLPENSALYVAPRVLLKVIAWGDHIDYGSTISFQCVRPVQIFPLSLGYLNTAFGDRASTVVKLNETRKRLPPFNGPKKKILQTFCERQQMGELTKQIMAYDREINLITRRQLG